MVGCCVVGADAAEVCVEDGYLGSGKRLWFSLNYHGRENHIKEILEFLPDRVTLRRREKEIVTSDLIKENLCMNLIGQCQFLF